MKLIGPPARYLQLINQKVAETFLQTSDTVQPSRLKNVGQAPSDSII